MASVALDAWRLDGVVRQLRAARVAFDGARRHALGRGALPSREVLVAIVRGLRAALFPAHFGPADLTEDAVDFFVGHTLDHTLVLLREQITRGLGFGCDHPREDGGSCLGCARRAGEITRAYAAGLPDIRAVLETDLRAASASDETATSPDEAVFSVPGVTAILHHRLAHPLQLLQVPLIPRLVADIARTETGIDIHPGARIGESFFIDHGTGVVIGETCVIGARVRLHQGVTLAGASVAAPTRHPVVEDDVVIQAGATLLGPIVVGQGSSIGGNVWLTRSVPPRSVVTQAHARHEVFGDGSGI
jgi:serine O-acetyltransferase